MFFKKRKTKQLKTKEQKEYPKFTITLIEKILVPDTHLRTKNFFVDILQALEQNNCSAIGEIILENLSQENSIKDLQLDYLNLEGINLEKTLTINTLQPNEKKKILYTITLSSEQLKRIKKMVEKEKEAGPNQKTNFVFMLRSVLITEFDIKVQAYSTVIFSIDSDEVFNQKNHWQSTFEFMNKSDFAVHLRKVTIKWKNVSVLTENPVTIVQPHERWRSNIFEVIDQNYPHFENIVEWTIVPVITKLLQLGFENDNN